MLRIGLSSSRNQRTVLFHFEIRSC